MKFGNNQFRNNSFFFSPNKSNNIKPGRAGPVRAYKSIIERCIHSFGNTVCLALFLLLWLWLFRSRSLTQIGEIDLGQ